MVNPQNAETHILEDEAASRAYIRQVWAEAMVIYRRDRPKLVLPKEIQENLKKIQCRFMPEDTKAGMILAYLESYTGSQVCSKQLYQEALKHDFDEPKQWEIRVINDIMNNTVTGWKVFLNPRRFERYGRQKGWERDNGDPATGCNFPDNFEEIPDEIAQQMEIPF